MTSDAGPPPGYVPYERNNPFLDWFGQIYVDRSDGRIRFCLQAMPQHSNGRTVHGGVLTSLADLVLGMSVRETGGAAATISLNCDFVAAAQVGDWIEGEAEITRRTSSVVFVRGTLTCGGRVLMNMSGIWKPIEQRPAQPAATAGG